MSIDNDSFPGSCRLEINKKTAEELYRLLYRSETKLTQELIDLMDHMEKSYFNSYAIAEMEVLTGE